MKILNAMIAAACLALASGCGAGGLAAQCSTSADCSCGHTCATTLSPAVCVAAKGVCERLAAINLCEKGGNCAGQTCGSNVFVVGKCEQNLSACSTNELCQLQDFAGCLENLSICKAGGEAAWQAAYTACYQPIATVGQACVAGITSK